MFRAIRPRLPCCGLALAALVGIAVADRWSLPLSGLLGLVALAASAALTWLRSWLVALFCGLAFAALHTVRHGQNPARELERAIHDGPRLARVVGVVATEPEALPFFSRSQSGTFHLRVEQLEIADAAVDFTAHLTVVWAGPLPGYGDRVSMAGSLRSIGGPRNPGQFDLRSHLRRKGVLAQLEAKFPADCRILAHDAGHPIMAAAIRARQWMQKQLSRDLEDSPELATLIASMVLGLRGDTPEDVQDLFRRTGTLHLFAVSGLNVAMLAVIATTVFQPLGRRVAPLLTIPVLVFYALVTGLSPSCVRAAIMGVLVLLALVLERPGAIYNSLAAAALLILAWDTNQLFVPGFQFSFALVFVIVCLADRLTKKLEPLARPDPFLPPPLWSWRQRVTAAGGKVLAASIGVTISAWLGSLLFTAGYFHLISPSALLANMIAVPLAFCVLALGLASVLAALISPALAVLFNNANWLCAQGLLTSVKIFAALPGAYHYVELPQRVTPPACEITVLDAGEGAAIHLRSAGRDWLIDGGHERSYRRTTLPYLRSRGVNRLDALILSHGDAEHISAALAVIEDFAPRTIFDSPLKDRSAARRDLHAALVKQARGKAFLQRGDVQECGAARVRVLFPPAGITRSLADDKALVLRVECAGVRVLLMSDAGFATERWLLENETDLRAEILIKGHHSRDLSGTRDFLGKVQPQVIVVGPLDYGHPASELDPWAKEIAPLGATLFRQDECGALVLAIGDGTFAVRSWINGQSFRSRAQ
jgi:ComEC/Rec2-related protein